MITSTDKKHFQNIPVSAYSEGTFIPNGYAVLSQLEQIENKETLLFSFYDAEHCKARLFCQEDDYIWQHWKDGGTKWALSEACLTGSRYCYDNVYVVPGPALTKLSEWTGCNKGSFWHILERYQELCRWNRSKMKNQKAVEKMEKRMECIGKIPEDFGRFIHNHVLPHYVVYNRKKDFGYCTHCKKTFSLKGLKPKHKAAGRCPKCHKPITFLSEGISRGSLFDQETAMYLQDTDRPNELCFRMFAVTASYVDYKNPKVHYVEVVRSFLQGEHEEDYEKRCDRVGNYRFVKCIRRKKWYGISDGIHTVFQGTGYLYTRNLNRVLKKVGLQYSLLRTAPEKYGNQPWRYYRWIQEYQKHPMIESLHKIGFYKIVNEIVSSSFRHCDVDYDDSEHTVTGFLKVSKFEFNRLLQIGNPTADQLKVAQAGKKLSEEEYTLFSEFVDNIDRIKEYLPYTTAHKMLSYLYEQRDTMTDRQFSNMKHDYLDYLDMEKKLGYDIGNVLYPRDLAKAHDTAFKQWQQEKDEILTKKFAERISGLKKKYADSVDGLIFVIPTNADDLTAEGNALHNCVGTYMERVAEGKSDIIFIRKADNPKTPYCTMEVKGSRIVQVRTKYNKDPEPAVWEAVKKYEKKRHLFFKHQAYA